MRRPNPAHALDAGLRFSSIRASLARASDAQRWTAQMKIARNILLVAACFALCGCHPSEVTLAGGPWQYSEVNRTKSPDSAVDAVLMSGDAGATTATEYYLYLVPSGQQASPRSEGENRACFTADHLKNLKLNWRDSRLLELHYEEARIHHFQNMWQHREVSNFQYVVELRLAPTSADVGLPVRDKVWQ